jgi:hypothetical protein
MISRIVTTMALMAGTALLCLPVQAQTGTYDQGTTMAPKSGGTTNSPAMSSQRKMGPRYQAQAQAQPRAAGRTGDMAERQMTDCLNTAAAQGQSTDSCKR